MHQPPGLHDAASNVRNDSPRWPDPEASAAREFGQWFRRRSPGTTTTERRLDGGRSEKLARVEAALFVAGEPLSARKLVQFALLADFNEARDLIDQLNAAYDHDATAFRVESVGTGFQLVTRAKFGRWLSRLHTRQAELKLSPPALETMTIVAYRQPITRADVEAIRGVQSAELLKQLMEKDLVRISGEDDSLGRPYLYGTTRRFLEIFGLKSLKELPMSAELCLPARDSNEATDRQAPDAGENAAPAK